MKILIAITCYRCAYQITRVLERLAKSKILNEIDHIAIIDNQSPDDTVVQSLAWIEKLNLKEKVHLYLNDENYGLGGSHKIVFDLACSLKMDYVFILHGDDQAEISDLEKMLFFIKKNGNYSAILGSRFSRESKLIGYQKKRIFGNMILNWIYSLFTFHKTLDLGSGLNVFKLSDIQKINYYNLSNNFTFNAELLLSMYSVKFKICFFPITWKEEDQISNVKNFQVAIKMLRSLFLWRFLSLPAEKKIYYQTQRMN